MIRNKKTRWRSKAAVVAGRSAFLFFVRRALESSGPPFRSKKRASLSIRSRRHAARRCAPRGCREQSTERAARSTARIKKKRLGPLELKKRKKSVVGTERREVRRSRPSLDFSSVFDQRLSRTYQRERGVRGDEGREGGGAGHQLGDGGGLSELKRGRARGKGGGGAKGDDGEGQRSREKKTREQERAKGSNWLSLFFFAKFSQVSRGRRRILLPPRSAASLRASPPFSAPWGPWRRASRPWGRRRPWRARGERRRGGREPFLLLLAGTRSRERERRRRWRRKRQSEQVEREKKRKKKLCLSPKTLSKRERPRHTRTRGEQASSTSLFLFSLERRAALSSSSSEELGEEKKTKGKKGQSQNQIFDRHQTTADVHRLQNSLSRRSGKHLLARSLFPA